jgi:carbamoyl-phosphate synthase small subunit
MQDYPTIIASKSLNAVTVLSDGLFFFGKGVGNFGKAIGEICFNTGLTGYQETITDPSYSGQIITFTFPHIGNVGVNDRDNESNGKFAQGIILRADITNPANFRSQSHFNDWLIKNNITGICDVDTRELTLNIRENGARTAIIHHAKEGEEINVSALLAEIKDLPDLKGQDIAKKVSTEKPYEWQEGSFDFATQTHKKLNSAKYHIVAIDYGIKENILRGLADLGCKITVVNAQTPFTEIAALAPDGVFLSNGPGDPAATGKYACPIIQEIIKAKIPLFGICLGHQLLSLATGLKTIKMQQGHRGSNHPVQNLQNNKVEISSQNHGFCVTDENLPANVEITHISLFDKTIEGIKLKDAPAFSVQHHPEASPGTHDSKYLFEEFINLVAENKKHA